MEKYLRTKYAICELNDGWELFCKDKLADTIEKLCDEFIVTATSHYSAYIAETHTLEEAIEYCENNHMPKTKIRGAIWTDKGLIYVAKMNKEGDFELI